jgi:hypothetical protein
MEKKYWLRRGKAAAAMARDANSAEARLIHFELAGRYSIKAANLDPPFLLADQGPVLAGERAVIRPFN